MRGKSVELLTLGHWLLGAEQIDGHLVQDRLFIVTEITTASFTDFFSRVEQINRFFLLGRGYVLKAFGEPCLGCEVMVSNGWELSSPAMQHEFLARFIKTLELESMRDESPNR